MKYGSLERVRLERDQTIRVAAQELRAALRRGQTLLAWLEEDGSHVYAPESEQDIETMLTALDVLSSALWSLRIAREKSRLAQDVASDVEAVWRAILPAETKGDQRKKTGVDPEHVERSKSNADRPRVRKMRADLQERTEPAEPPVPGASDAGSDADRPGSTPVLSEPSVPEPPSAALEPAVIAARCWLCGVGAAEYVANQRCNADRGVGRTACPGTLRPIGLPLTEIAPEERRFPVRNGGARYTVPWELGQKAYDAFAAQSKESKSIESIVDRGGFAFDAMDCLLGCGRFHNGKHTPQDRERLRHAWIRQAEPV